MKTKEIFFEHKKNLIYSYIIITMTVLIKIHLHLFDTCVKKVLY